MDVLTNKTILIVEDDADMREVFRLVLEAAGAKVITAESVEAALKIHRKSPPQAVITDIQLGSSDGYALFTEIPKIDANYRGLTTVFAVTGFGWLEDKRRGLEEGFNGYIRKRFEVAEVV